MVDAVVVVGRVLVVVEDAEVVVVERIGVVRLVEGEVVEVVVELVEGLVVVVLPPGAAPAASHQATIVAPTTMLAIPVATTRLSPTRSV